MSVAIDIEVSDGILGDLRGFRYGMEDLCSRLLAEETRRMKMGILRQHDYGKWFRSVVIGKPVWE